MRGISREVSEKAVASLWRTIGLILLSALWGSGPGGEAGVILLLFLAVMAVARWRFPLPGWTVLIDQAACVLAMFFWPQGAFALALPFFDAWLAGQAWFLLPGVIYLVFAEHLSLVLAASLSQAAVAGWILGHWSRESQAYRRDADKQRRDRYELEAVRGELLTANVQAARTAELAERNRIAQQLHDEVGHELTGAVLALQAFEQLWQEGDAQAGEMFLQVKKRLTNSASQLRETVHNIKPVVPLGVERLQAIVEAFPGCPVNFEVYGDTATVPPHLWGIIEPCLKEALTNVARHSNATKVDIVLDVTPHIVRLSVHDNGAISGETRSGLGIRNLRQRARAVGGSIAVDSSQGFRLVCVLPQGDEFTGSRM